MTATVFFDGVCNLCNAAVRFIAKRDPRDYFQFVTLQSAQGETMLRKIGVQSTTDSIVLWEDDECFQASSAALRIARRLKFPWPLLYAAILVPRFLRDPIYGWIARNRYRWFGKKDFCELTDEGPRNPKNGVSPPPNH